MNKKRWGIGLVAVGLVVASLAAFVLLHGSDPVTQGSGAVFANRTSGCATSEGLYYSQRDSRMDYLDFKTKQSVPLCNKPNCPHNDNEKCDAYLGEEMSLNLTVAYGGKLYLFTNVHNKMQILRADPDGKNRVKIAETNMGLLLDNVYALQDKIVFSGSIVYYKENGEFKDMGGCMVQILDLKTNEIQTIGNIEQSLQTMSYCISQNGDLLFLAEDRAVRQGDETNNTYVRTYSSYHIKSGKHKTILTDTDLLLVCTNNEFGYYTAAENKQIRRFNLLTEEDTLLLESDRTIELESNLFDHKLGYCNYIPDTSSESYIEGVPLKIDPSYYTLDLQTNQPKKLDYEDKTIQQIQRKNATPDGYIVQIAYTDGSYRLAFMTKADFDEGNTGNYVELWFQE